MTTTSIFQIKPDYYKTQRECEESKYNYKQTNIRYKNFYQTHFTAGDESQFEEYIDINDQNIYIKKINIEKNLYNKDKIDIWDGNKNINGYSIMNTFKYIFYKFKKGIYIKIKDNKLKVFLPFSNVNYINEWGDKIKIDPKYESIYSFMKEIYDKDMEDKENKKEFNTHKININTSKWYANNCLLRYEYPLSEKDTNVPVMKNMLEELCEKRDIPDIEFFINRRDFPIIKKDKTEPYHNIWNSEEQPLVSHNYEKYMPIFSMSNTDKYGDLLIPTHDDWIRIQNKEDKWFPPSCRYYDDKYVKWDDKKYNKAVFRGSSTGCGVTIETNTRLKLANMMNDEKMREYLDVGITKWNIRPRKLIGEDYLKIIETDKLPIKLTNYLSTQEQSYYKYIINIDGNVSAFRLSLELSLGSVILLVKSEWKIWYSNLLKEYEHYVPIKEDLSDLIKQIEWCRNNDKECEKIANNARNFYEKYLMKDGCLDYLQKLLIETKKEMGQYIYNYKNILDIQIDNEYKLVIDRYYPSTLKNINNIKELPYYFYRRYNYLTGIEWIINMILDNTKKDVELQNNLELQKYIKKNNIISENKLGKVINYSLLNYPLAIKKTTNIIKSKEHIHETFVGKYCINKLLKQIPNFIYIYGLYKEIEENNEISTNVIVEKININDNINNELTLDKWIDSNEFNMNDFIYLLYQISLSIYIAQKTYGFVHYDLTPWNILLQKKDKIQQFDYILSINNIIRIDTKLIPIIIDYGKSHVIYNGKHYGYINMNKYSSIQDILTLLIFSIQKILKKDLNKEDIDTVIYLSNFLTGNNFYKNINKRLSDVKNFIHNMAHYSIITTVDKYELDEKTPLDFIDYIIKRKKNILPIKYINRYEYKNYLNKSNSRQIYDYILSSTFDERIKSYLNVFYRVRQCVIPQPNNLLLIYYSAQLLYDSLLSVKKDMLSFLNISNKINKDYDIVATNTINFIYTFYNKLINKSKHENIYYELNNLYYKSINYNSYTFLDINYILENINIIQKNNNNGEIILKNVDDITDYINIIEFILINNNEFKLNDNNYNYYFNNFKSLLNTNFINIKNNIANYNTFIYLSSLIYSINIKEIEKDIKYNKIDINSNEYIYIKNYIQKCNDILTKIKN
jgi:hypothetical protein